ncbi:guanine nucleotide exchange factor [Chytridium lagenaria]|nr:guanine nucleotide exchange factor [Chytridium lagenaria]
MLPTGDLANASTTEITSALGGFLNIHMQSTVFVKPKGPYELSAKEAFVAQLIYALMFENGLWRKNGWSDAVTTLALQCLRILAREVEGCESVYTEEGIRMLIQHSTPQYDGALVGPQQIEALKCLTNCCLHAESRSTFTRLGGIDVIVGILKKNESLDAWFLALRITFLLTAQSPTTLRRLERDYDLVQLLDNVLKPTSEKLLSSSALTSGFANEVMVISDVFKIIFNGMVSNQSFGSSQIFGSSTSVVSKTNEKKRETSKPYERLLPYVVDILVKYPVNSSNAISPPHNHAIHCLLNFALNDANKSLWGGREGLNSLSDRLLDILSISLKKLLPYQAGCGLMKSDHLVLDGYSADEVLPPVLLVLRDISRDDLEVRNHIVNIIMPKDIDRSKHLDEADTLTSRMIKLMTSVAENLKTCVSELFFILCDEQAPALVNYVGYGNAAGFLFQKGLLAGSVPTGIGAPDGPGGNIDPITGEISQQTRNEEWDKLTDEEKEIETTKLIEMFEKLEKTGIIKVASANNN